MTTAMILAGGVGMRLGREIPKQYLEVSGKPVLVYCLEAMQNHPMVDQIVIVAAEDWRDTIRQWLETFGITKFYKFADPGRSRQASVLNGLNVLDCAGAAEEDVIIIHDAARPNVSAEIISQCISHLAEYDGTLPVIPMKDSIYQSKDGKEVHCLLNRNELFCGQSPEGFRLKAFYKLHENISEAELDLVSGCSQLAFMNNLRIRLFPGEEKNYKITTQPDLEKFVQYIIQLEEVDH